MKMSPLLSLRGRTFALCNCCTAQQVDLILLLLCSGECNTKNLHKTNIIVSILRDASQFLDLKREGWLSSDCVPGSWAVREAEHQYQYWLCRHRGSGMAVSKAEAATNSKSKLSISSVWLQMPLKIHKIMMLMAIKIRKAC